MSEFSEKDKAVVRQALHQLGEHFDTARVFVTRHDGAKDSTDAFSCGTGNFYAQQGQIHEWLLRMDTRAEDEESRESEGDE